MSARRAIVLTILLMQLSVATAGMKSKHWICENGARTIGLTFDQKDENVTYQICADRICKTPESSGRAKQLSSVGSNYLYGITGSKIEERLTIYFSENSNKGAIPSNGTIRRVDKSTNNISDPSENFQKCSATTT